jgi:hypothetical protein
MSAEVDVEHVRDANVDDTEEALVTALELALVKDLDGDHGRVLDRAADGSR